MSDSNQPPVGTLPTPAPAADPAPAPTPPTPAPAPAAAPQTMEELTALLEKERSERQAANREAQQHRSELRKLQEAEEARKQAAMTEEERMKSELSALKQEKQQWETDRKQLATRGSVLATATRLGIVDPDAAYELLNKNAVEFDENGTPKNVETLLNEMVKAKPYLLATVNGANSANPQRGAATAPNPVLERLNAQRGASDPFGLPPR